MENKKTLTKIKEILEPVLKSQALELVDIELKRESMGMVLRLFIEKEGGIDIDTCCRVSKAISPLLDARDLIAGRYHLEVSSPGIERPLTRPDDFKRFIGSKALIKTIKPINERRRFTGILKAASNQAVIIACEKDLYEIPYELISRAHLVIDIKF